MGFAESARSWKLIDNHILRAECPNRAGEWIESDLDLDTCLGNENGAFQWGGKDFSGKAGEIKLDGVFLTAWLPARDGQMKGEYVILDNRISNDDGKLHFA
ncbi:uncharacterized protein FIESC28_07692 [Fusarium coffeatum]|uniref:Cyanovirin-N domain-containing protein n=1 Tax=Fusarium coffeatum TaxID=231269 RepID=A0A366RDP4_9HYPO|nr:uncharacterized protein FIESC28_07692 [Fusarium coffeatum]RBR14456.1 hypothetical protein FIESC28_07692 [Fusarium coffeatum]